MMKKRLKHTYFNSPCKPKYSIKTCLIMSWNKPYLITTWFKQYSRVLFSSFSGLFGNLKEIINVSSAFLETLTTDVKIEDCDSVATAVAGKTLYFFFDFWKVFLMKNFHIFKFFEFFILFFCSSGAPYWKRLSDPCWNHEKSLHGILYQSWQSWTTFGEIRANSWGNFCFFIYNFL